MYKVYDAFVTLWLWLQRHKFFIEGFTPPPERLNAAQPSCTTAFSQFSSFLMDKLVCLSCENAHNQESLSRASSVLKVALLMAVTVVVFSPTYGRKHIVHVI